MRLTGLAATIDAALLLIGSISPVGFAGLLDGVVHRGRLPSPASATA